MPCISANKKAPINPKYVANDNQEPSRDLKKVMPPVDEPIKKDKKSSK